MAEGWWRPLEQPNAYPPSPGRAAPGRAAKRRLLLTYSTLDVGPRGISTMDLARFRPRSGVINNQHV